MSEPSLKLLVAWSDRRNLCSTVVDTLRENVGEDVRSVGDDAVLIHTAKSPEDIRNSLPSALDADEGLLVVEFEKWSGYGRAVDAEWLLARGH
jgi:hypothetical protein